jgi:hypothetical protein
MREIHVHPPTACPHSRTGERAVHGFPLSQLLHAPIPKVEVHHENTGSGRVDQHDILVGGKKLREAVGERGLLRLRGWSHVLPALPPLRSRIPPCACQEDDVPSLDQCTSRDRLQIEDRR